MSSVAPYSHKQDQLVNVRFRHWIVNGVCLNTLPPFILSPIFNPPDKLDAFFGSIRSGAAFTADVRTNRSCCRFRIENEDDLPRLFAFKEAPSDLRIVRGMANEAAQANRFLIPQNIWLLESSVIRSLFKSDGERDATSREDMGDWSDSKGKRLEGRAVAVEVQKVADRVIGTGHPVEKKRRRKASQGVLSLLNDQ